MGTLQVGSGGIGPTTRRGARKLAGHFEFLKISLNTLSISSPYRLFHTQTENLSNIIQTQIYTNLSFTQIS